MLAWLDVETEGRSSQEERHVHCGVQADYDYESSIRRLLTTQRRSAMLCVDLSPRKPITRSPARGAGLAISVECTRRREILLQSTLQ